MRLSPRKDKGPASIGSRARTPWAGKVQLRYATTLTDEQYVCQRAWERANLPSCPLHPRGGCGLCRHASYERKRPAGARVARYYCPDGRMTFSLLPDCLASRLSGSLGAVEATVAAAEAAPSLTQAAQQLRPELVDVRSALRWLRRRTAPVRAALVALVTLLPELSGVPPTVAAVGGVLGEPVLVVARQRLSQRLQSLSSPVGFRPRVRTRRRQSRGGQHNAGPDPPPPLR